MVRCKSILFFCNTITQNCEIIRQTQEELTMIEITLETIQADPKLQNLTYFYVIHGTIPEIEPNVAYRRVGAEEQHRRKILKCPFCSARLSDMDTGTRVELYGHTNRVTVKCQFYIRCACCQKEVGINLA
jgi:hypothetical protein